MEKKEKTLRDVMPNELTEWPDVRAYKMLDVKVEAEHGHPFDDDGVPWIGTHKNVFYWVELENGYAVGWNENPARGWSFPVVKMKEK
jgi:hypothetical protein